jgi:5-methylcytosine-specific restriction endonuclease McrA
VSRKPTVQECRKKYDGRCFVCGEDDYIVLDAHRVVPGEIGGAYHWNNLLTLCACCHRKVTAGTIRVHARYLGTRGPVVHWTDESGSEHFTNESESKVHHGNPEPQGEHGR